MRLLLLLLFCYPKVFGRDRKAKGRKDGWMAPHCLSVCLEGDVGGRLFSRWQRTLFFSAIALYSAGRLMWVQLCLGCQDKGCVLEELNLGDGDEKKEVSAKREELLYYIEIMEINAFTVTRSDCCWYYNWTAQWDQPMAKTEK